jgi:hypothetical protein
MSEKIYAWVLRLYPAKFRQAYRADALQLFRDRLRDETGFFSRLRLWIDIFLDLAVSVPFQYSGPRPAFSRAPGPHIAGAPCFFLLEAASLGPASPVSGCAVILTAVVLLTSPLSPVGASIRLMSRADT